MGSQTLEILRQVWASLTGGYYFDPESGVFCNVVHLYLWLFLFLFPFVVYLYFPGTWLTWCIYCFLTSATILSVKLINMALHRLYDRAQSMSDSNLKHQFFKITKETTAREDDTGMELKVLANNCSRGSVENAIHEASDENSMLSMENINSIIDLKVDVHRKNSSESIELMFYPPSRGSQQDQHSIAGSASVSKSLRSNNTATGISTGDKYLMVYPEHENEIAKHSQQEQQSAANAGSNPQTNAIAISSISSSTRQPHLLRKSSEDFKRRHQQRRRMEIRRQRSLETAPCSETISTRLMRNTSDSLAAATRHETFLHPQQSIYQNNNTVSPKTTTATKTTPSKTSTTSTSTAISSLTSTSTLTTNALHLNAQRLPTTADFATAATAAAATSTSTANSTIMPTTTTSSSERRSARLQRHRSSETHDERLKQQSRSGIYLSIHHEHNHHHHHHHRTTSSASSIGALANISSKLMHGNELNHSLAGALQSWLLGSSSDVYMEDDSCTKSDYGIEQLDDCTVESTGRTTFLSQQQHQQQLQQQNQKSQRFRHQRQGGIKRRRHSNVTSSFKNSSGGNNASSDAMLLDDIDGIGDLALSCATPQTSVRRIKSTALEISCPRPSISNLSPHPNSVEAINGQQQIRNNNASLLPPPSKCLVRNPHLSTLCPKFGGSFGGSSASGNNLTFGVNTSSDSTLALIEPVYAIAETGDKKANEKSSSGGSSSSSKHQKRQRRSHDSAERQKQENIDGGDIDVLSIIETAMQIRDGHVDEDDDDAVDDVPVQRRRKALGCRQDRRSVESDVGEILADGEEDEYVDVDVDEFKDFDDNLEHILQDLQHTQNQLDDLKAAFDQEIANIEENRAVIIQPIDQDKPPIDEEDDFDEPTDSQVAMRERVHSTDSETDNKGSRSPLLSNKKYDILDAKANEADKALRKDIIELQQKHKTTPTVKQKPSHVHELQACGEGDSGCPSSDCEQISASSKDMLLSGLNASECDVNKPKSLEISVNPKSSKETDECEEDGNAESELKQCETNPKQLGAIPKIIKYREVDEMNLGRIEGPSTSSNIAQLHRRRGGGSGNNKSNSSCCTSRAQGNSNLDDRSLNSMNSTKAISRTSSSTSSCSLTAQNLSNDMQKMLWLIHGGALDEHGRLIPGDPQNTNVAIPPNLSVTQFQMYHEALKVLNEQAAQESNSTDGRSLSEQRHQAREKARRRFKQTTEATYNNASYVDYSHHHLHQHQHPHHHHNHHHHAIELQTAGQLNNRLLIDGGGAPLSCDSGSGRASIHRHSPFGVVVTTSTLNSRNVSNAATLSMQGLFDAINEERNATNQARGSSSGSGPNAGSVANAATATLLNVDGHGHIENYCDYWRPACMLSTEKPIVPKSFYKYRLKCCGYEHDFKISMDRLELLALFDRDLHWLHVILSFILSAMVAYLGATILQHGYYKDLFALVFCAVIAGSQYSLIKSVQPDAASPIHGFNKTVAYSRAIYFCLCGGLLLVFENLKTKYEETPPNMFTFFGVDYSPAELNTCLLQVMYILLLCFPIIFSLGLFPQINTFLIYFLEQVDMHIFGGNAAGSLLGAFFCVVRSLLGVCLLYGPLYAALIDGRGTQYIVFSIFCAMLVPLGYHLSRSSSDLSHVWALIINCIVSTYRDDDDEFSASSSGISSQKLGIDTAKRRSKHSLEQECDNNEHIEMSSIEKFASIDGRGDEVSTRNFHNLEHKRSRSKASSLASSSQTIAKTKSSMKKVATDSNSFISIDGAVAVNFGVDSVAISKSDREIALNDGNGSTAIPPEVDIAASAAASSMVERHTEEQREPVVAVNDDVDEISTSSTTNPGDMSTLTAGGVVDINTGGEHGNKIDNESPDPLPKKLQTTVNTRLKNDLVVMSFLAIAIIGLHSSTVFTVLQPDLNIVLYVFTAVLGLTLHYIVPQMRKHMPWLCFSRPLLRQKEFGQFEVANAAKIMWFEKAYIYLCMVERNVIFPLLAISALTADAQSIVLKYGMIWGPLIVAVCALKFIRNAYSDPTNQYLIVIFTVLLFRVDFAVSSESFLIDFFFVSIAYRKCCDFLLKLQFIVTYIAPWQITWGSAFHAFAQPFSVPHSAMLFLQAGVSAALSTPLNPFLGSAIFLTSYVRPIKFWERDYNTRRIDHSNTRLVSQLERDLGADDNNLNSIFYEHLTRSLQHSLCGDLLMGRWGNVNQGDCFVLASDYLNCLVHIIELGNGLCTFQMRGLEFRGTYCQQREVEAISEDVEDNDGCCCCDPGHLPRLLSANAMFSTRWLAWQVVAAQYVLEGYSISDNLASATLQVFEYRKVLITYYIKSIIYYVIKNAKLEQWLSSGPIQDALLHTLNRQFVDLDPIFNHNLDEDFDFRAMGVTRSSFCYVYLSWINFCYDKRKDHQNEGFTTPMSQQHVSNDPGSNNSNTTNNHNHNNSNSNNNNNDSKSTPNLSTATLTTAHTGKSQSQQQLRGKPQKSATMSSGAIVNNSSSDHIATSQSYANIMRQTSESAPGLSGAGFGFPLTNNSEAGVITQTHLDNNSLNSSAIVVGGGGGAFGAASGNSTSMLRTPLGMTRGSSMKTPKNIEDNKSNPKEEADTSPLPITAKEHERLERPIIKLKVPTVGKDSPIVSLCLALGLLARRSLATASHGSLTGVEFFLHGLHALFKGDFRITSPRDEWVFADMELLHAVVAPAVKMALKLQQDHILNPDEFLDPQTLFEAIDSCAKDLVISHEADPVWRSAVLRGAPNLLALRHVMEDGSDEYRIIRLAKRFLSFRVIKLNRECVRGLWAGQQQELIYLRNRNPERGSIQNAKQALRNIINSSCDQPIGYPIYVSPLTTSYADTNEQLCKVIGGAITLESIRSTLLDWWHHIRERCRQGCSSGSAMGPAGESTELAPVYISPPIYNTLIVNNCIPSRTPTIGVGGSLSGQYGSDGLANSIRGTGLAVPLKPTSTTLFATLINREQEALRELRALRKSQTQGTHAVGISMQRGERERRATLPIASTSLGVVDTVMTSSGMNDAAQNYDTHLDMTAVEGATGNSSPRYAKFSSSSGSLGIGNIITTPGDYPRKTKGPICLAAIPRDSSKLNESTSAQRKPRFDLNKKVIIVDGTEIYDCLDLGRRIDVTWPNEEMRLRGGHMSWKNWSPRVGMVGEIVHYWIPNHCDAWFRSHVDRVVYLLEIGEHFVPVGESGLREYNQIVGDDLSAPSTSAITTNSSRHSLIHYHQEIDERKQQQQLLQQHPRENLTPMSNREREPPTIRNSENVKIQAVSSSSSEDDYDTGVLNFEMHKRDVLMNVWKMIAAEKQQKQIKMEKQQKEQENVSIERSETDQEIQSNETNLQKEQTAEIPFTGTTVPTVSNDQELTEHQTCQQQKEDPEDVETLKTRTTLYLTVIDKSTAADSSDYKESNENSDSSKIAENSTEDSVAEIKDTETKCESTELNETEIEQQDDSQSNNEIII